MFRSRDIKSSFHRSSDPRNLQTPRKLHYKVRSDATKSALIDRGSRNLHFEVHVVLRLP